MFNSGSRVLLLGVLASVGLASTALTTSALSQGVVLQNSVINSAGRELSGGNLKSLTSLGEAISHPAVTTGGNLVLRPGWIPKKKQSAQDPSAIEPQVIELNGLVSSFPNPFQSLTTIRFGLAESSDARVEVYDVTGRRVRTLIDGPVEAGLHDVIWDGRSDRGNRLASGVYFTRLVAKGFSDKKKLTLQR